MTRCSDPKTRYFKYYGGRGITVCQEWVESRMAFIDWALSQGWSEGLEIDRFPNKDGNYEPGNCRFVTHTENVRNQRTISEVAFPDGSHIGPTAAGKLLGVSRQRIDQLLQDGRLTAVWIGDVRHLNSIEVLRFKKERTK